MTDDGGSGRVRRRGGVVAARGAALAWIVGAVAIAVVGALLGARLWFGSGGTAAVTGGGASAGDAPRVPVEVVEGRVGAIEQRRAFSGGLEATARVDVAPRIAGRLVTVTVDLGDEVTRGQVVATLDRAEREQEVAQARAELAVRRAALAGAESAAQITRREYERLSTLHGQAIVSDSELDAAKADDQAAMAAVEMARAQILLAEAAVVSAQIRLDDTAVRAEWSEGDDRRVVAARYAEEGSTVSAGSPVVSVVELTPIKAVIYATESDYASLAPGQGVEVTTGAYPGRVWTGRIDRVAPVFGEGSRQARIEVLIANEDAALKPGMFIRAEAVLARVEDAVIVPEAALAVREGRNVVFVVAEDGASVRMVPVELGVRHDGLVELRGGGSAAAGRRVVTLGQQFLSDGSAVRVVDAAGADTGGHLGGASGELDE